jgi:16S rRNA (uracil1498-N3)-methyltransferase
MRLLFVESGQCSGGRVSLDREQSHYLSRVLRLEAGTELTVVPRGGNSLFRGLLAFERAGAATLTGCREQPLPPAPSPRLTLVVAALKSDRLEWALQKAVELGVDEFRVARSNHSVKIPGDATARRLALVAESACQQSGRCRLPELSVGESLDQSLEHLRQAGAQLLVFHPEPPAALLREVTLVPGRPVACFIGPEGGFSAIEVERLRTPEDARAVRLEGNILRAETAAVAASALLLARLDRL